MQDGDAGAGARHEAAARAARPTSFCLAAEPLYGTPGRGNFSVSNFEHQRHRLDQRNKKATSTSGGTKIEHRRTAMPRRARPQWRRSIRVGGGNDWICLADEARCCEDDARDERSLAAIQQYFTKHMGHDGLHSGTPWPKDGCKVLGNG